PRDNGSFYDYNISISKSGDAVVSEAMRYSGAREGDLRQYYRSLKDEEQKQVFQQMIKGVSATAELLDYRVNNAETLSGPFTLDLKYGVKDFFQKAGDIRIAQLPGFAIGAERIEEVSLSARRYPVKYSGSGSVLGRYFSYSITIPAGYETVSLPEPVSLSNKYGSFAAGCRQEKPDLVNCGLRWERTANTIAAKDYAQYKNFLETAANYTKKQLFFRDRAGSGK
ncbi:MAG: hypothetical protein PHW69_10060, partial [Elusimicrobiaceae bacterium]|nr:hypothetical protein [Elusimicrobiaceae bacterium]